VASPLRLRLQAEDGMTLTELAVVMGLLGVVLAALLGVLNSVEMGLARQDDRMQSNDQARLAASELDREIRSGNVFYDPASENDTAHGIYPGMSMRIYTQANGNVRTPSSQCVQWRIYNQQLQRRSWATTWRDDPTNLVSGWRVIADHIMNQTVSPQVPAFTLDTSQASYGGRIAKIVILANENPSSGRTVEIDESVTGRDTEYGYPNGVCSDIPPYP